MINDFAVVTCFFSYNKNERAARRYEEFCNNLKRQGVKLYTVELAFSDEEYLLKESVYLRLRTNTVLWHKESLLNILVKRLPMHIKKVAWLDCDVFIKDDDWAQKTSDLLKRYKIIQLGSEHLYLSINGDVERRHKTLGYGVHHSCDWKNYKEYHPGLGWAASRDLFSSHGGLFEYAISGGGDGLMGYIFAGGGGGDRDDMKNWIINWKYNIYKEICPSFIDKVKDYKSKVESYVNGSVSYLESKIFHRYHAPQSRRGYRSRPNILKGINFHKDLLRSKNGLFKWKDMRYNLVFQKFFSMKDDPLPLRRSISYDKVNLENVL